MTLPNWNPANDDFEVEWKEVFLTRWRLAMSANECLASSFLFKGVLFYSYIFFQIASILFILDSVCSKINKNSKYNGGCRNKTALTGPRVIRVSFVVCFFSGESVERKRHCVTRYIDKVQNWL